MTKGIKHKDIGEDLSRTEFEADDSHELESGTSFPGSPVEKDRFYRTDLHEWYIYNGSVWKVLGGTDISDADAAVGDVKSGKTFYAGAEPKKTGTLTLFAQSLSEASWTSSTGYVKRKDMEVEMTGYTPWTTLATSFQIRQAGGTTVFGKIFKNGGTHGTERSTTSESYVTFTEDLVFAHLDNAQLYLKVASATWFGFCQQFMVGPVSDYTVVCDDC